MVKKEYLTFVLSQIIFLTDESTFPEIVSPCNTLAVIDFLFESTSSGYDNVSHYLRSGH